MAQKHPLHLLAWHLNGSLNPEDQQRLEQHLHDCFYCQQESLQLKQLKHQLNQLWIEAQPGDLELKRLLKEVQPHTPDKPLQLPRTLSPRQRRWSILGLVIVLESLLILWLVKDAPVSATAPANWTWQVYQASNTQLSSLIRQQPPQLLIGPNAQNQWLLAWPAGQAPLWLEREKTQLTPTDRNALRRFLAQ